MPRNRRIPNLDEGTFLKMKDVLARVSGPTEEDFALYCGRTVSAWQIGVAKRYSTWEEYERFKLTLHEKHQARKNKKAADAELNPEAEQNDPVSQEDIRMEPVQAERTTISESIAAIGELLVVPKNDIRPEQSIAETVGWSNSMLCIIKRLVKGIAENQSLEMAQYPLLLSIGQEIVVRLDALLSALGIVISKEEPAEDTTTIKED